MPDSLHLYEKVARAAGFYHLPEAGFLTLAGEDRLAFLQRQTTNDMSLLEPGRALLNVLTSPTARILDVLTVLHTPDALELLTLPGRREATFRFLKSRIFFMDRVTVEDHSSEWAQVDLVGPQAEALLDRVAGALPRPGQAVAGQMGNVTVRLVHPSNHAGLGFRLLLPPGVFKTITGALEAAGAALLDSSTYNTLRIEHGRPAAGSELSEDFTPLEIGLEQAISGSKGCYTGQEIIARQITYDKVTQRLCGLRLEGPARPGDRVVIEEKSVGRVTSAAVSPRFGPLALAVIRRPHHEPGTSVQVITAQSGGAELPIRGEVSLLPFPEPE